MPKQGRIYKWRPGSTFKADAQEAGEFLEELREKNGGVLTTTAVYEAAQDQDSPLHDDFEWDVEKAARAHWRERARDVMRHLAVVRIKTQKAPSGVPAFMSVNVTQGKRGYVSADQVKSSADFREQVIDQALRLLNGLKSRFETIQELDGIWKAIATAEKRRARQKGKIKN
jgi:hypothetical protein